MPADPYAALALDFYRRTAARYDDWAGGANVRAADRLIQLAAVLPDERVIDIGCGTGLFVGRLGSGPDDNARVGVDLSTEMLSIARQRAGRGGPSFGVMNARDLMIRDGVFDVAVMGQTLGYLSDPWRGLAEARRVLRPAGRIAVSCRCQSLSTPAQKLFFDRLTNLAIRLPRTPDHHGMFGEPWVLGDMLRIAGFTDVTVTQLLVGTHAESVRDWTDMMGLAGPWPNAILGLLSEAARSTFEENLDTAMHALGEGDYAFHGGFTFAVARRA